MKRYCQQLMTFVLMWMFAIASFAGSSVSATFDPSSIIQGQSFTITYVYTGAFEEFNPNLEDFEKDFIVYGKNVSAEMVIVNGVSNMNTQLVLTLIPKNSGKTIIPSIRFAKGMSDPISIVVKESGQVPKVTTDRAAFMEATAEPKSQFIQAQINYSVKLYYATNLANSNLTDPSAEDAVVMRTDNDKQYQAMVGKQRYQVLERNYAIFPQKSGTLTVKSAMFTGIEQKDAPSFNGLNNMVMNNGGKPIRMRAKDVTVEIKPMLPITNGSAWLPAKKLEIREGWSKLDGKIKVGDPITRTIIISATGLTADQLPDLGHETLDGVNIYPDKAVTQNTLQGGDIIGQRQEKIAYIATKPGELVLPPIQVNWFDVTKQVERVSVVPSRAITIYPGPDAQAAPAAPAPAPVAAVAKPEVKAEPVKPAFKPLEEPGIWEQVPIWIWLMALFAFAWIFTLIAWFTSVRLRNRGVKTDIKVAATPSQQQASKRRIINEIHAGCTSNQAKKVRDALLQWAKLQWPDHTIHNLSMLANWVGDGPLRDELLGLDETLYAETSQQWFGQSLWTEFSQYKGPKSGKNKVGFADLPPLYPQ